MPTGFYSAFVFAAVLGLSGCGSFKQVLDSNDDRVEQHKKFQVNRIGMVSTCYTNATTDALKHGCQMLQMQLQTEQGFTVTAEQSALPDTPEKQVKDGVISVVKIQAGVKLGEKLIDSLNRPNDVVKVPEIYEVEKPVFFSTPAVPVTP